MCGIAGFISINNQLTGYNRTNVCSMIDRLIHRGPDDSGVWVDDQAGIALGHRRLSIIDISPAGHQPMRSASGRYIISFNGEIYNFKDIRNELEGMGCAPPWHGKSDTEVLLAAIECWGLEEALQKSTGMFALALWDKKERVLFLARDRMGEKPVYYGWSNGIFLFASELKALKVHSAFDAQINREVLPFYLQYGYIPTPYSIYKGILKLPAGTFIKLECAELVRRYPAPVPYWKLLDIITAGQAKQFAGSDEDAVEILKKLLLSSIQNQMVSDVPLGAFLSGGIDSSTVVAMMQSLSSRPVKTFTIGFKESGFDEAAHAKAIAKFLGTDHTELYVSDKDAMSVIPKLHTIYDEPFGDSSQIPTFLLSQMTRQYVTVSLSGDGGDELFGGYTRYARTIKDWATIKRFHKFFRNFFGNILLAMPLDMANNLLAGVLGGKNRPSPSEQFKMVAMLLKAKSFEQYYQIKLSSWKRPEEVLKNPGTIKMLHADHSQSQGNLFEKMMYIDTLRYLPDDILVKVDRAAMANSLETRIPLLDHRIVEFSWTLPLAMKLRLDKGKWILREVLKKYMPISMFDRPKSGFAIPVEIWLRGPLRDWAEELLSERRIKEEGIFKPGPIRKRWQDHLRGRYQSHGALWALLMFQSWMMENE